MRGAVLSQPEGTAMIQYQGDLVKELGVVASVNCIAHATMRPFRAHIKRHRLAPAKILPGWEKLEMGCIKPVVGAPLAMGGGRVGGGAETRGGDTPTGRGGSGRGGTPGRALAMGAMAGIPGGGKRSIGRAHLRCVIDICGGALPKPAWGGRDSGGCFILAGNAGGRGWPWSLSLMSFMAMENSWMSMRPSLFMSAKALRAQKKKCM